MDRLAAHILATAVLTAALAAVPAAMAQPTSAASTVKGAPPAATGSPTPSAAISAPPAGAGAVAAPVPTSPAALGPVPGSTPIPAPKPTSTRPVLVPIPCPDAYQVGTTAYARWHGMIAFSVKQFYSPTCHTVYGYAYPWLQFRNLKQRYDLGLAVFDLTHDAIVGARTFVDGAGGPDFWSAPFVPTAGTCTQGLTHVFFPDTETDTFTVKFCL